MQNTRYTVIDYISICPNKVVVYPRFFPTFSNNSEKEEKGKFTAELPMSEAMVKQLEMWGVEIPSHPKVIAAPPVQTAKEAPISNKHNFELSKQAQKNLREKVNWLYHFAKKKTIVTKSGKQLTEFKMNFATLKLPSVQFHSSDFITKNCLNQLFIEISKKHDFRNYVWRLEYQKNGNLHYHIATDTYIDYYFLNRTWNRILNKYGYVDQYTRKFSSFSLADYIKSQPSATHEDFEKHAKRYAKGCRENWKNPNSVDVKAVFGKNNIAGYISKYMAKNDTDATDKKLPICENNSKNSRLWFCSRSLSKADKVREVRESMDVDVFGTLAAIDTVKKIVHDYCTVLYFDLKKIPAIASRMVNTLLQLYQKEISYLPAL